MQNDSSLRAITNRLNVTPVDDLPRVADFLAAQLANCRLELLFADTKARDNSVTAHKLKTRISSLLQERSPAGRYTAVVLIKAVVDHGGINGLRASEGWARGLLNCLNKPDPVALKALYLVTLTRIFCLAQDDPTLLREVATPLLPSFIKTCLGLLKPIDVHNGGTESKSVPSPLLHPVLKCWNQLLPRQASIFRPSLDQIQMFCLELIGGGDTSVQSRDLASELLCLLLSSTPKNTFTQEWTRMASNIIESAHVTASQLFRAVIEEHEPNNPAFQTIPWKENFSKEPKSSEHGKFGFRSWKGIYEGSNRLMALLSWLSHLVSTPTPLPVAAPIGALLDLTARLTVVTVPDFKGDAGNSLRLHKEASREEKEELWLNLPKIHMACLHVLHATWSAYRQALVPVQRTIAIQILDLFDNMCWHNGVRYEAYRLCTTLLADVDVLNLELRPAVLSRLIEHCCNDLKAEFAEEKINASSTGTQIDLKAKTTQGNHAQISSTNASVMRRSETCRAAWKLLPELLKEFPASSTPRQLRIEMERVAVLLDHEDAMLASVINPVISKENKSTASLLPFLARSNTESSAIEALLRPRMPVVHGTNVASSEKPDDHVSSDADEEEDVQNHGDESVPSPETSFNEVADGDSLEVLPKENNLLKSMMSDQMLQISGLQKRPFENLESEAKEKAFSADQEPEERETKRSKPSADPSDVVMGLEESQNEGQILRPSGGDDVNAISMAADIPSMKGKEPDHSSMSSRPQNLQAEDSDSSDFEIPAIDPGFDTDEVLE
ncbi:rRNA processing/ribosome biogenesis-domain-containing protein [Exophiala viscosa]|uniref:rRNA processing/ribosome biogenesis-domain-containing protein n=1 Tax=Exophiala viscosa TaxID=2486360 RepID=UPI0021A19941|nr:rRNA processing/ribosome biogenesis-domain-containing protein [Exophiala viscosa]